MNKLMAIVATLLFAGSHVAGAKQVANGQCEGYQKPGANVCLLSPRHIHLKSGSESKTVTLRFLAGRDAQNVAIRLIDTPFAKWKSQPQKMASEHRPVIERDIQVSAPEQGYGYMHVLVQTGAGRHMRTRVISIPVQVGNTDAKAILKTEGVLKTAPNGEKVVSFNGSD